MIPFLQFDRNQATAPLAGKIHQRRLLHGAVRRGHEDELIVAVFRNGQHRRDPLVTRQGQNVHHRTASGRSTRGRYLKHPQPVNLATIGKAENRIVSVGYHQAFDEVLILDSTGHLAPATTPLGTVGRQRLGLGVTPIGQRDDHVFFLDQVLRGEVFLGLDDLRAAFIAVFIPQRNQLLADDLDEHRLIIQDIQQPGDGIHDLAVFLDQPILFHVGQAVEAHIEDRLRLIFGQIVITVVLEPVALVHVLGLHRIRPGSFQHRHHGVGSPGLGQQFFPGLLGAGRCLDQFDHRIDVGQRHR